ncbi:MAG: FecR domain-containing protein [Bacteroidota bacterium]
MKIDSDILYKYRNGLCTPEELEVLMKYFKENNLEDFDSILLDDWNDFNEETSAEFVEEKEEIFTRLEQSTDLDTSKSLTFQSPWLRIAAAVAVLIISIGVFRIFTSQNGGENLLVEKNTTTEPLKLTLDDGSWVWLKPNSWLEFPKKFDEEVRQVKLYGEARFKIKTNPQRSFYVQTEEVFTKVLGTTFNVKAYPGRQIIEVALLEGKVEVEIEKDSMRDLADSLEPGQVFTYQRESGKFSKDEIEFKTKYDWTEGEITLEGAEFSEVTEVLENWYGLSIVVPEGESIDEHLVIRLDTRSMEIDQIIDGINLVAKYHKYVKVGDKQYELRSK